MIKKGEQLVTFLPGHHVEKDFFEKLWDDSWIYVKTVVNAGTEPVLILDKDFFVLAANKSFYRTFQVTKNETEGSHFSQLGNRQWDIASLNRLLSKLLTSDTAFKGFEITRSFPTIGNKVMLLNARKMYYRKNPRSEKFLPVILLAIEDITDLVSAAHSYARKLSHQHE